MTTRSDAVARAEKILGVALDNNPEVIEAPARHGLAESQPTPMTEEGRADCRRLVQSAIAHGLATAPVNGPATRPRSKGAWRWGAKAATVAALSCLCYTAGLGAGGRPTEQEAIGGLCRLIESPKGSSAAEEWRVREINTARIYFNAGVMTTLASRFGLPSGANDYDWAVASYRAWAAACGRTGTTNLLSGLP